MSIKAKVCPANFTCFMLEVAMRDGDRQKQHELGENNQRENQLALPTARNSLSNLQSLVCQCSS